MRNAQYPPNTPQVDAIHVQTEGVLTHRLGIPLMVRMRRILAMAPIAQIALAARRIHADFILPVGTATVRTGHTSILPPTQPFCHSHKIGYAS